MELGLINERVTGAFKIIQTITQELSDSKMTTNNNQFPSNYVEIVPSYANTQDNNDDHINVSDSDNDSDSENDSDSDNDSNLGNNGEFISLTPNNINQNTVGGHSGDGDVESDDSDGDSDSDEDDSESDSDNENESVMMGDIKSIQIEMNNVCDDTNINNVEDILVKHAVDDVVDDVVNMVEGNNVVNNMGGVNVVEEVNVEEGQTDESHMDGVNVVEDISVEGSDLTNTELDNLSADGSVIDYEALKVSDLRLILRKQKGLTKRNADKLKKNEVIELLRTN